MAKIVTRPAVGDANNVATLSEVITNASLGTIGDVSAGAKMQIADTMDGLIDQASQLFDTMTHTLDVMGMQLIATQVDLIATRLDLDVTQDAFANLIGGVDYDEALDHAAMDLMDCFSASGVADVTADGDLAFDERVTFSKSDLKPMLREAIVKWIEVKMAQ